MGSNSAVSGSMFERALRDSERQPLAKERLAEFHARTEQGLSTLAHEEAPLLGVSSVVASNPALLLSGIRLSVECVVSGVTLSALTVTRDSCWS